MKDCQTQEREGVGFFFLSENIDCKITCGSEGLRDRRHGRKQEGEGAAAGMHGDLREVKCSETWRRRI